jgi:hypothetical protein
MKRTLKLILLALILYAPSSSMAQLSLGGGLLHNFSDGESAVNAGARAMYGFNDYFRIDVEYSVFLFSTKHVSGYYSNFCSSMPTSELGINLNLYLKKNKLFYFIAGYTRDYYFYKYINFNTVNEVFYDFTNLGLGGQIQLGPKLNILLEAKVQAPFSEYRTNLMGVFNAYLVYSFRQ